MAKQNGAVPATEEADGSRISPSAEVQQAIGDLEKLELSQLEYLARMSRELRIPLTNIIGFSRLLLKEADGSVPEQQSDDLEIIHWAAADQIPSQAPGPSIPRYL